MRKIKTTTRNVKQHIRKFTDEQRRDIIRQIENRPSNVPMSEMFKKFGFGTSGATYYNWRKMYHIEKSTILHSRGLFTEEEKRNFISQIENLPEGTTKSKIFKKNGIRKSDYYSWRSKYGVTPMNVKTVVKSTGKQVHTVTLSVEVSSIMELISFCTEILKTPKVKKVLSVE